MVWMRLWLQKRSPMWAVQIRRPYHQVLLLWTRVSPKVNARTVTGRKHSQLTSVPEHSTGSEAWLAALEDPGTTLPPRPAA